VEARTGEGGPGRASGASGASGESGESGATVRERCDGTRAVRRYASGARCASGASGAANKSACAAGQRRMRTSWSIPCSRRAPCPYDATARMTGEVERVPLASLAAIVRLRCFFVRGVGAEGDE